MKQDSGNHLFSFVAVLALAGLTILASIGSVKISKQALGTQSVAQAQQNQQNPQGNSPFSTGYYTSFDSCRDNNCEARVIPADGTNGVPVISLHQIPAGNYFVTFVGSQLQTYPMCSLNPSDFSVPTPIVSLWFYAHSAQINFTEATTLAQTSDITVYCRRATESGPPEDLFVDKVSLSAIRVSNLVVNP